jgi:membrane-associated HD superfamily phosphohydrolase
MSVFENPFAIAATISLFIQIIVLGLIFFGYSLKRKQKFRQHGITMIVAVVLHAITIFAVMVPSFASGFSPPGAVDLSNMIVVVALVHAIAGVVAFVLGVGLTASWRFRRDLAPCFARKQIMRITISIWVIALLLGILLYWFFYLSNMVA